MLTMLGIPNCDTVKKARKFLDANAVSFEFRDLRKTPLDDAEWRALLEQDADGALINTRGPSFRKLGVKLDELDVDGKVDALLTQPTIMKRPVMVESGRLCSIGFKEERFQEYVG